MAEGASASALALLLIFGANAVLAISLWAHQRLAKRASSQYSALQTDDHDDVPAAAPNAHAKQLSEPLGLSLSSIRALSFELLRLSLVLLIPYICEKHPIFPHSKKVECSTVLLVIVDLPSHSTNSKAHIVAFKYYRCCSSTQAEFTLHSLILLHSAGA
jgi:hypothetical protein